MASTKAADGVTTYYPRNALGEVTGELAGKAWTDFVDSVEGDRIAMLVTQQGGGTSEYFLHAGPLGTLRAITDANGNNILNCGQNSSYAQGSMLTYAPFGVEAGGCAQSTADFKFADLERDAESGGTTPTRACTPRTPRAS